jgi:UDP-3-O-[3-hydroxymyristoyl] glucosamine N-acyltransferase
VSVGAGVFVGAGVSVGAGVFVGAGVSVGRAFSVALASAVAVRSISSAALAIVSAVAAAWPSGVLIRTAPIMALTTKHRTSNPTAPMIKLRLFT